MVHVEMKGMPDMLCKRVCSLFGIVISLSLALAATSVVAQSIDGRWHPIEGRPDCKYFKPERTNIERFQDTAGIKWTGGCKDGYVHGFGTLTETSKAGLVEITGTYRDGKLKGIATFEGTHTKENKTVSFLYKGETNGGEMEGQGELTLQGRFIITGSFENNVPKGHVRVTVKNKMVLEGEIKEGWDVFGPGKISYANGDQYEGEVLNFTKNGRGVLIEANGTRKEGVFVDDYLNGAGLVVLQNGFRFEGTFKDGLLSGTGRAVLPNGDRYEGDFENGFIVGAGVKTYHDGSRYEGQFDKLTRSGEGTLILSNGDTCKGEWADDKLVGKGFGRHNDTPSACSIDHNGKVRFVGTP